jgi:hypothetical protein
MMPSLKPLMSMLAVGLLASPVFAAETADAIFINGKIATLDAKGTQAEGVAVKDGRLIAVGSSAEIKAYAGSGTQVVDLQGKRVLPGLVDAHTHPLETLWMKNDWVDARYPETPSVAVTLQKIAARAKASQPGEWIYVACVSASENKFAEKRLPTRLVGRARTQCRKPRCRKPRHNARGALQESSAFHLSLLLQRLFRSDHPLWQSRRVPSTKFPVISNLDSEKVPTPIKNPLLKCSKEES